MAIRDDSVPSASSRRVLIKSVRRSTQPAWVYRVPDAKLNHDVALKVLPESFANDGDRFARIDPSVARLTLQ